MALVPANRCNTEKVSRQSDHHEWSDMIFRFLEDDSEDSSESTSESSGWFNEGEIVRETEEEGEEEDENSDNRQENKAFWESQDELLKATLCRNSPLESRIRHAVKEAVREIKLKGLDCSCSQRPARKSCRNCMQREVSGRLRISSFNCVICKSKWGSTPEIPSGEHTYMEVVEKSSSRNREVRVVVELNFRAEFEMARAGEEYNRLVNRLPEIFIGKTERLRNLVKILCSASKKCMKEKKMHFAPWRKQKYMQAKWLGMPDPREKTISAILPVESLNRRPARQLASMLTFDLVENFPGLHCAAIKVL